MYYHCVPKARCVHKVRQVLSEYKDNIVLVYTADVIVLSQYRMSNCQHVHVVESNGICSLDVLKIFKIKASHWSRLSPFILTIYKQKVIHARYTDLTEILRETVFPQIDSRLENTKQYILPLCVHNCRWQYHLL